MPHCDNDVPGHPGPVKDIGTELPEAQETVGAEELVSYVVPRVDQPRERPRGQAVNTVVTPGGSRRAAGREDGQGVGVVLYLLQRG